MNVDADLDLRRRRLLGWSLALAPTAPGVDIGRDLSLVDGPGGKDFATVEGIDNLSQTLTVAILTPQGGDVFNTSYGFDGLNALVEETDPLMIQERVRVSIIRVVTSDPRVSRIVDVDLADGRLVVPGAATRELDVTVAFQAVSGDDASLNLGPVIANG
jgi:hypothetical protein